MCPFSIAPCQGFPRHGRTPPPAPTQRQPEVFCPTPHSSPVSPTTAPSLQSPKGLTSHTSIFRPPTFLTTVHKGPGCVSFSLLCPSLVVNMCYLCIDPEFFPRPKRIGVIREPFSRAENHVHYLTSPGDGFCFQDSSPGLSHKLNLGVFILVLFFFRAPPGWGGVACSIA